MLRGMTSRQLSELIAFCSLEPVDDGLQRIAASWFSIYDRSLGGKSNPADWMRDFEAEIRDEDDEKRFAAIKDLLLRIAPHGDHIRNRR